MATSRRLFIQRPHPLPTASEPNQAFALEPDELHYARDVLRLKEGDEVIVSDGLGHEAEAVLQVVGPKAWAAQTNGPFELAQGLHSVPKLIVACPLPKGERADWMAEKLAELGVYAWVWVVCARSVVLPKGANKQDRLLRIMRAAARQARHGRVPQLLGPMALTDHLHEVQAGPPSSRFVADAAGSTAAAALGAAHSATRHMLVGPEGGLTPDELQAAHAAGYGRLALGPHILRVETAAMACCILMGQADI